MASSLYQNSGPGRPPPPGTYRQNQPPPPPPAQYGASNAYNYTGAQPPAYAAPGPPRQMAYNPTYVYGSPGNSGPYGPPGVSNQSQYPPLPPFSLLSPPPPPPPPSLPPPSVPAPPPMQSTQASHHRMSFPSSGSSISQPHKVGVHTPYYPPSVPSHHTQLQLPPAPHSSSSQPTSHGNFPSTLPKQQSLPPLPPPPAHDSLKENLNSFLPPPPPISNASSIQSVSAVTSRQSTAQVPAPNNWVSGSEANHAGTMQGDWSSGREGNNARSTQGAWNFPLSQSLAYPSAMQGVASSQEMTAGVVPADNSAVAKTAKVPAMTKSAVPGIARKADGRFDSEQDPREAKKREYEKKKLEGKREKDVSSMVHKIHLGGTPLTKYTSGTGLRDSRADRKSLDKVDNRLKRPSTFLCKIKFRNELPDPLSQPKLLQVYNDKDRYSKYTITSLEKMQKHRLLVDSDLGIPLDLLDISVYNPPKVTPPMDLEDEELLLDDEKMPSAKVESIRKKDRPTDKGVAWLVKTQYISPISLDPAKQSLTEKQAKELKEMKEGKRDMLDSLNDREKQIRSIEESFRVAKLRPVHQTKPALEPVEILPLLPDFERFGEKLTHVTFDGEPTADSELHSKLDHTVRDDLEALAILKSYILSEPETGKKERFLAYMVPKVDELNKDLYDENEEISYTWMREYHCEMRPDDSQSLSTYIFSFDDCSVRYLPLDSKISLQKKKAKEGRSKEDADISYAVPSSVTVRRRELLQEEEEEREANRTALMEGSMPAGSLNSYHSKRRLSHEVELLPAPKRREGNKRYQSDDEEEVYM